MLFCVLGLCHVGNLPAGCQRPLWPRHAPLNSLRDDLRQSFLVAYPAPSHPNTNPPSCANRCYACTPSSHVTILRCWPGVQRSPPKTRRTGGGKALWLMSIRMTCASTMCAALAKYRRMTAEAPQPGGPCLHAAFALLPVTSVGAPLRQLRVRAVLAHLTFISRSSSFLISLNPFLRRRDGF